MTRNPFLSLVISAMALASCAPQPGGPYRDGKVAISSTTAFDPAGFLGPWEQVAAFGPEAACGRLTEVWSQENGGLLVRAEACRAGQRHTAESPVRIVGPGRLSRGGLTGREEWILWIDADQRVAAVGAPDGSFGRILARPGQARADLLEAARQVLDFNGYDISRLIFAK
ncbi:MAG: lipocalin family protein [Paracoccaceae bacterium]